MKAIMYSAGLDGVWCNSTTYSDQQSKQTCISAKNTYWVNQTQSDTGVCAVCEAIKEKCDLLVPETYTRNQCIKHFACVATDSEWPFSLTREAICRNWDAVAELRSDTASPPPPPPPAISSGDTSGGRGRSLLAQIERRRAESKDAELARVAEVRAFDGSLTGKDMC